MKKNYIQPQTVELHFTGSRELCGNTADLYVGSGGNRVDNVWGAPMRKLNVMYI